MATAAEAMEILMAPIFEEKDAAMEQVTNMQLELAENKELMKQRSNELKDAKFKTDLVNTKLKLAERMASTYSEQLKVAQAALDNAEIKNGIMDKHINRLRSEIESFPEGDDDKRVIALQGQVSLMKEQEQLKNDQIDILKQSIRDERAQGVMKQETADKAKEELEATQKEMETTSNTNAILDRKIAALTANAEAKDMQIDSISQRADMFLEQLKETTQNLVDSETAAADNQKKQEDLNKQIQDLTTQVAEKDADLEEQNETIKQKDKELASAGDREAALNTEIETLNARIDELSTSASTAQSEIGKRDGQITSLNDELTTLKDTLKTSQEEMDKLNEEIVRLSVTTKDADGKEVTSAGLKDYVGLIKTKDETIKAQREEFLRLEEIIKEKDDFIRKQRSDMAEQEEKNRKRMQDNINLIAETKGIKQENERLLKAEMSARSSLETVIAEIAEKDANLTEVSSELSNTKVELALLEDTSRDQEDKLEEYESLVDELREQLQQAIDTSETLTQETEEKDTQIEKLSEELEAIKTGELPRAKERTAELEAQVSVLDTTIKGREERLEGLQKQVESFRKIITDLNGELGKTKDKLETFEAVESKQRDRTLEDVQQKLARAETENAELQKRITKANDTIKEKQGDIQQRIEQVRGLFANLSAKEEEVKILTEKSKFFETQWENEKAVVGGSEERIAAANEGWEKARDDVDSLWSKVNDLQVRLNDSEETATAKSSEAELTKQWAVNEQFLAKSKDERLKILSDRMRAVRDDMRSKDERLVLLKEVRKRMAEEEYKLKDRLDVSQKETEAQVEKVKELASQIVEKEHQLQKLELEVKSRDEKIAVLNKRVDLARSEVSMQLEMLESKVAQSREDFDTKSRSAEEQLKQVVDQTKEEDVSIRAKYRELESSFGKTKQALKAKDSLVHMMTQKLNKANNALVSKEDELEDVENALNARITDLESQLRSQTEEDSTFTEEARLAKSELQAQKEINREMQSKLIAAETGGAAKEEQLTQMQSLLTDMKDDLKTQQKNMSKVTKASDPAAAAVEAEETGLKEAYFNSVCLLVKTQMFESGNMQNVLSDELFQEVLESGKPYSEWPAWVFSKAFDYEA